MVDHLNKNSRKELKEFTIVSNETKYLGVLELIDNRIKITLALGRSQFKWIGVYTIEQLYKLNAIFMICNTIENAYEYLKEILQSNSLEIKKDEQKMILTFTLMQFNVKLSFDIQLTQEEIDPNDAMRDINHQILEMQKQIEDLEMNQKSKDIKIKEQDEEIKIQKNEIEELKNKMQQMQEENLKQIEEIQNNFSKFQQYFGQKILKFGEMEQIGQWIHQGKMKMELKRIYCATKDGFEISKFYEKYSNITPTLIVIETTGNKRFGGYTDLIWKNNSGYVASNPNKSFLFSLDLNQKYTSNEPNCQHAIYGDSSRIAFGSGFDLCIYNNSNTSQNQSYVNCGSYGKNEGLKSYDLNGGDRYFFTKEIEVFQVILS